MALTPHEKRQARARRRRYLAKEDKREMDRASARERMRRKRALDKALKTLGIVPLDSD